MRYKFRKEFNSKIALLKAAYNYTDKAFIHLDSDDDYYFVDIEIKSGVDHIRENEFMNEMLAQSVRHEIYLQTKNIRELILARAMATTVITHQDTEMIAMESPDPYSEDEVLKDWFSK